MGRSRSPLIRIIPRGAAAKAVPPDNSQKVSRSQDELALLLMRRLEWVIQSGNLVGTFCATKVDQKPVNNPPVTTHWGAARVLENPWG